MEISALLYAEKPLTNIIKLSSHEDHTKMVHKREYYRLDLWSGDLTMIVYNQISNIGRVFLLFGTVRYALIFHC